MKKPNQFLSNNLKKVIFILFLFIFTSHLFSAVPGRISIQSGQFYVCGSRIWMCGANTPWDNWNDFGGSYDAAWWDSHYAQFNTYGLNSSRVWITCSGEVGINIDSTGYVSGATAAHWSNLDDFFTKANNRGVYIMATLISFDHFKDSYTTYQRWRNWINSDSNIDSYINNYLIPFLTRYGNNPALWCIDMTNEPEWATTDEGGVISWTRFQTFWAKAAVAIHANSEVLVTVGMGVIKYNSDNPGMNGNKVSDAALQARVADSRAKLDFYSPHWYSWMDPYWTILMYGTPSSFGIGDKPCVIGECSAMGSTGHTLTQDYESAYTNGWQGMLPWTSNGVDSNGGWDQVSPASNSFKNNHYSLVFPTCGTATRTPTINLSHTRTFTPTITFTPTPLPPYTLIYDGDTSGYRLSDGTVHNGGSGTMTETTGGQTGNGMLLSYTNPNWWQEHWWDKTTNISIGANTHLVFNIKVVSGSVSQFLVRMNWSNNYPNVANYLIEGGSIDTTWKTARIPLSVLLEAGQTLIDFIDFINNSTADYTVMIDNIRLEGAAATVTNTPIQTNTFTRTRTQTPTYTRTHTASATRTNTLAITNTFTGTPTRTATPTYTRTATGTATRTNTQVITNTFTGTQTRTITPTYTRTATRTNTLAITNTFTGTQTRTITPTYTRTYTGTATRTNTLAITNTFTGTLTYSRTPTPTNTLIITNTFTGTPTRTVTSSQVESSTRTATMTLTQISTYTRTSTPTNTLTSTLTRTNTTTPTFFQTATSSQQPTNTHTISPTHSISPTITQTWTGTPPSPTNTPTITSSRTITVTFTGTPTSTFTRTVTTTNTSIPATVTFTSTRTASPTLTRISTGTNTSIPTNTFTPTRTSTSTYTRTATPTNTHTISPTHSISPTITQTWTGTPPSPTNTPTITSSRTITVTFTGTPTSTFTRTVTATNTLVPPTATNTSIPPTATFTRTNTAMPPTATFTTTNTNTLTGTATRTVTSSQVPSTTFTLTNTYTNTPTATFTQTPTSSQQPTMTMTPTPTQIINQQQTINNVVVYPDPYNPDKDNLKIKFEITQPCKTIKIKIYTTGYRLIKQITQPRNYNSGDNNIEIEGRYINKLANGVYYLIITVKNLEGKEINSKPQILVIIR